MSSPPDPPPMRHMRNYNWVNEWETVDWYTGIGKIYREVATPNKNFIEKLFGCDYKDKLTSSLKRNREMFGD